MLGKHLWVFGRDHLAQVKTLSVSVNGLSTSRHKRGPSSLVRMKDYTEGSSSSGDEVYKELESVTRRISTSKFEGKQPSREDLARQRTLNRATRKLSNLRKRRDSIRESGASPEERKRQIERI